MATLFDLAANLGSGIDKKRSEVALVALNEKTDTPVGDAFRFQYYPQNITDSYQTNRVAHSIPGGSLPVYQWVSGGPRKISFEAYFSCDTDLLAKPAQKELLYNRLKDTGAAEKNIDIRGAIVWLRSFMYPSYRNGDLTPVSSLTYAPRKCLLIIPNSGIGLSSNLSNESGSVIEDAIYCHMSQCEVTQLFAHPSGLPKLVSVRLEFEQVGQIQGHVQFPSAPVTDPTNSSGGIPTSYFKYPLIASGARKGNVVQFKDSAQTSVPAGPQFNQGLTQTSVISS